MESKKEVVKVNENNSEDIENSEVEVIKDDTAMDSETQEEPAQTEGSQQGTVIVADKEKGPKQELSLGNNTSDTKTVQVRKNTKVNIECVVVNVKDAATQYQKVESRQIQDDIAMDSETQEVPTQPEESPQGTVIIADKEEESKQEVSPGKNTSDTKQIPVRQDTKEYIEYVVIDVKNATAQYHKVESGKFQDDTAMDSETQEEPAQPERSPQGTVIIADKEEEPKQEVSPENNTSDTEPVLVRQNTKVYIEYVVVNVKDATTQYQKVELGKFQDDIAMDSEIQEEPAQTEESPQGTVIIADKQEEPKQEVSPENNTSDTNELQVKQDMKECSDHIVIYVKDAATEYDKKESVTFPWILHSRMRHEPAQQEVSPESNTSDTKPVQMRLKAKENVDHVVNVKDDATQYHNRDIGIFPDIHTQKKNYDKMMALFNRLGAERRAASQLGDFRPRTFNISPPQSESIPGCEPNNDNERPYQPLKSYMSVDDASVGETDQCNDQHNIENSEDVEVIQDDLAMDIKTEEEPAQPEGPPNGTVIVFDKEEEPIQKEVSLENNTSDTNELQVEQDIEENSDHVIVNFKDVATQYELDNKDDMNIMEAIFNRLDAERCTAAQLGDYRPRTFNISPPRHESAPGYEPNNDNERPNQPLKFHMDVGDGSVGETDQCNDQHNIEVSEDVEMIQDDLAMDIKTEEESAQPEGPPNGTVIVFGKEEKPKQKEVSLENNTSDIKEMHVKQDTKETNYHVVSTVKNTAEQHKKVQNPIRSRESRRQYNMRRLRHKMASPETFEREEGIFFLELSPTRDSQTKEENYNYTVQSLQPDEYGSDTSDEDDADMY